jgi:hypothetical protein
VHQAAAAVDSDARVAEAGSREEVHGTVDDATIEIFCSASATADAVLATAGAPAVGS